MYGGVTTSVDNSTDSTHTFVWAGDMPSYEVEESFNETSDIQNLWEGFIFNSCTLGLTVDGTLKFRGDWIAKNVNCAGSTATAATVPSNPPMNGLTGALDLGGAITNPVSWEISVNNNAKVGHAMGSAVPAWGASHNRSASWRSTISYEDTTMHQKLLGGTTRTVNETNSFTSVFSADNGVALGSGQQAVSIQLTSCQVTNISKAVNVNDFVIQELSGIGILGTGNCVDQILNAAF
jgi:hypothetical protein